MAPGWAPQAARLPGVAPELGQGGPGQPERRPLVGGDGTERAVEVDGGLVPIKHGPFQPRTAPLDGTSSQSTEQGPAHPPGPLLGHHEEVFQVQPVTAGPGRKRHEVHGHPNYVAGQIRDQGEHLRGGGEKGPPEVFFGGFDGRFGALVTGQLADEVDQLPDVVRDGLTYHGTVVARLSQVGPYLLSNRPMIIEIS